VLKQLTATVSVAAVVILWSLSAAALPNPALLLPERSRSASRAL